MGKFQATIPAMHSNKANTFNGCKSCSSSWLLPPLLLILDVKSINKAPTIGERKEPMQLNIRVIPDPVERTDVGYIYV